MPNQYTSKWNNEHKKWVEEHRYSFSTYDKLLEEFNKTFNVSATRNAIIGILRRNGGNAIICKDKNRATKEQITFIKKHYGTMTSNTLAIMFNEKFGTNYKGKNISDLAKRKGIKLSDEEKRKLIGLSTREQFSYPIGSEYKNKTNGYTYIKVRDIYHFGKKSFKENWITKQRYVYEKVHGKIPDNMIVIFLDGNKENFEIYNLCLVSKKEALHLKSLNWLGQKEITLAGIEVIRTEQILVDKGIIKRQKYDIERLRSFCKKSKTKKELSYET